MTATADPATGFPASWPELEACAACGSTGYEPAPTQQGASMRRCTACGTVRYAAVAPFEEIYQDGYHDGSADFGWDATDDAGRRYEMALNHQRLAWLEHHCGTRKVIDVGGGLGFFVAAAQERGWDATLGEVVPAAVRFAREELGVPAKLCAVEELAAEEEKWPLITLLHVVEHLTDAVGVLRQLRDAFTPDGLLYVELPNHGSISRRLNGDRWFGWQPGQHVSFFTPATLAATLERAGYEVVVRSTLVPGWSGLSADTYAHFLGLEPLLNRVVSARRGGGGSSAARGPDGTAAPDAGTDPSGSRHAPPPPIAELTGARRLVFDHGFRALRWVQERSPYGTNIRILARPAR